MPGLLDTALPLDRVGDGADTHPHPSSRMCVCVLTLGRLLPDTKFVPTADERLSAGLRTRNDPAALVWTWGRGKDQ